MTEILDSDDARGEPVREWVAGASYLPGPSDDEWLDAEPDEPQEPAEPGRWAQAARSVADPAALAVAAALATLCAALAGPSYVFQAYPFNQGVASLGSVFSQDGGTSRLRPLHEFLLNAAPTIVLLVVALMCATLGLLRAGRDAAPWVRPVAAGALVVTLALGALVGLGCYRASTLDLTVPSATTLGTA